MEDDAEDPDAYDEESGSGDDDDPPESSENPPSSGATESTRDGARPPPAHGSPSSAAIPSPANLTEPVNGAWDVMLKKLAQSFLRYRVCETRKIYMEIGFESDFNIYWTYLDNL